MVISTSWAGAYMQTVVGEEIENAKDAEDQHPAQQDGILRIILSAVWAFSRQ